MNIACHCLVKNEENWVGYALRSVIDYVDSIDLVDTGSEDRTLEIVKSLASPKINISQHPTSDVVEIANLRQYQLNRCNADWVLILDGDEVWTEEAIYTSRKTITENPDLDFLINKFTNCVGDVFHFQSPLAGQYKISSYKGNVTIRFFRRQPGVSYKLEYGREGLFYKESELQSSANNSRFISAPYLHMTHLERSSIEDSSTPLRRGKRKYELGKKVPNSYVYPRSFYIPTSWPSPWRKRTSYFVIRASWQTPLKYIRRRFLQ